MKRRIELFIFDLDGTLADTSTDIANAVNFALRELGRDPMPAERIISCVGDGLRVLMERCLSTREADVVRSAEEKFKKYYTQHLLDSTTLYPGTLEILNHYKDRKFAVASNKPEKFVRSILKKTGIDGFFGVVLGGDSAKRKKPFPDQPHAVLERIPSDKKKTVLVGDSANDVLAARDAGIYSCYVLSGFNKGNDLGALKPDYIVENIAGMKKYFI